jgi:type IV pilus assembly protein PilP
MSRTSTRLLGLQAAVLACTLSACGYTTEQDVRGFIDAERAAVRPVSKALPPPKPFEAANYDEGGRADPFSKQAFVQALVGPAKVGKPNIATPELTRPREPLEAFALDSMALVGLISQDGQAVALVRAEGKLYQVVTGNYLGQNLGKVTKIESTRITLREMVKDDLGDWSVRSTILKLQEMSK